MIEQGAVKDRPAGVLRNRAFWWVLAGQGLSSIGNGLTFVVLPLVVLGLTHSGARLGLLGMAQTLPAALVGLYAGAIADRFDRRTVMAVCDGARAVLVAFIPLAGVLGLPVLPVVYVVAVPISLLTPVFLAAYSGCLPELVGRANVQQANGFFQGASAAGFVCGPGLAAALLVVTGPVTALWIDAASFAASAVSLRLVRRAGQTEDDERPTDTVVAALRESLAFVRGSRVGSLLTFWACSSAANVLLVPAVAFWVTQNLGMPASVDAVLVLAYSIGAIGGFALSGAARTRRPAVLLNGGQVINAAALVLMLCAPDKLVMILAGAAAGAAGAMVTAVYVGVRTQLTPDRMLGRVSSLSELVTDAFGALTLLGSGLLLARLGGGVVLGGIAALMALTGIVFSLHPGLRTLRLDPSGRSVQGGGDR
jgi:MFS family permease